MCKRNLQINAKLSAQSHRRYSVFGLQLMGGVTTYVGKPSAIGQPTRPTQPVILPGSIK